MNPSQPQPARSSGCIPAHWGSGASSRLSGVGFNDRIAPLDENPNCRITHVSLRLIGDHLPTAEVTARTGLEPTFAADKGAARPAGPRSRSSVYTQPSGVWYVSSEGHVDSTSLERHLIWLLDRIEPARQALLAVAAEHGARVDFFVYWVSASGEGGPEITAPSLERIASLNASLGFDIYDESDDPPV